MQLLKITTPARWRADTIGHSYDVDNYPKSNKYQCFDYFAYFCKCEKMAVDLYCSITGYVGDLWQLREYKNFGKYFDFVTANELQDGDWIFWKSHVAMYYNGRELGQNQGSIKVNEIRLNRNGILGAMRLKRWNKKGVAHYFDKNEYGKYLTTTTVNFRTGAGIEYPIIRTLPQNTECTCYGYFDYSKDIKWLYVQVGDQVGFISSLYLKRGFLK